MEAVSRKYSERLTVKCKRSHLESKSKWGLVGFREAVVSSISELNLHITLVDWHIIFPVKATCITSAYLSGSKPRWKVNSYSYWFVNWWILQKCEFFPDKLYRIVEYWLFTSYLEMPEVSLVVGRFWNFFSLTIEYFTFYIYNWFSLIKIIFKHK